MQIRTRNVLNALCSMNNALEVDIAVVTGFGFGGARRQLSKAAATLSALAETQRDCVRSIRVLSARVRELRTALRADHMRPIVEIAQRKLAAETGFGFLTVPRRGVRVTELVMAARVMGDAIGPYSRSFIAMGLRADFVAQLEVATEELQLAEYGRRRHIGRRKQAVAGLLAGEREGRSVIRMVDALVRGRIRRNAVVMGRWTVASRIGGAGKERGRTARGSVRGEWPSEGAGG